MLSPIDEKAMINVHYYNAVPLNASCRKHILYCLPIKESITVLLKYLVVLLKSNIALYVLPFPLSYTYTMLSSAF